MKAGKLVHMLEGCPMFPKVRTVGNIERKAWSEYWGLECTKPSKTVQSQRDEADINNIVRNFGVTGKLPQGVRVPTYGDFDGIDDYRTAIEAVRQADEAFLAMPSELRQRLGNDPQKFVEWCADAGNLEEMRKLGLAVQKPEVLQGTEAGTGA
jgi:phage internal scaffolding protein